MNPKAPANRTHSRRFAPLPGTSEVAKRLECGDSSPLFEAGSWRVDPARPESPDVPEPARILVIGYGNPLRGDDAAGPLIAEQVAAWKRPGVEAIAVHQLTPELAPKVASSSCVIFVDAAVPTGAGSDDPVTVRRVAPASRHDPVSHTMDPEALLGLTQSTCGVVPLSWFLTIRAANFDLGAGLSAVTREGVRQALRWVEQWLAGQDASSGCGLD